MEELPGFVYVNLLYRKDEYYSEKNLIRVGQCLTLIFVYPPRANDL